MSLEYHPLADRYPLMADDEFETFKADIRERGLLTPILRYEGKVLDGRHRLLACEETGVEPRFEDFVGTEEEAAKEVASRNEHRRHLTPEWRRQRVAELKAAGLSNRAIAEAVGCGETTVRRDLQIPPAPCGAGGSLGDSGNEDEPEDYTTLEVLETLEQQAADRGDYEEAAEHRADKKRVAKRLASDQSPPPPPKVTGRDGKQYPASRPPATPPAPRPAPAPAKPPPAVGAVSAAKLPKPERRIPNYSLSYTGWRAWCCPHPDRHRSW